MAETTGITDIEWLDQKVCELSAAIEQRDQIIAGLLEALDEAIDVWASHLNAMPSTRGRKRLDEIRTLLSEAALKTEGR